MRKNYNYTCRYYSGKGLGSNEICYLADIVNIANYSPFGVQLDGRTITSEKYRYGYQGQETDDEVKGEGNSVNYKYRMHDPRIGRFFAVDPLTKKYPNYTPYSFSGNKVIHAIELEGLEEFIIIGIPSTNVTLENVNIGDVKIAMAGINASTNGMLIPIPVVAPATDGSGTTVDLITGVLIWDPTARERGEGGQIQYRNFPGVTNDNRGLTQQEKQSTFIKAALNIKTGTADFEQKKDDARVTSISDGVMSASPSNNDSQNAESIKNYAIYTPPVILNTEFVGGTATPTGGLSPEDQGSISRIANILNANPGAGVDITGNTWPAGGVRVTAGTPVGGGGGFPTFGALATGRANMFRDVLTAAPYNVNPTQITTGIGNLNSGASNVTTRITGAGGSPPNNGNRIDGL